MDAAGPRTLHVYPQRAGKHNPAHRPASAQSQNPVDPPRRADEKTSGARATDQTTHAALNRGGTTANGPHTFPPQEEIAFLVDHDTAALSILRRMDAPGAPGKKICFFFQPPRLAGRGARGRFTKTWRAAFLAERQRRPSR